MIRMKLFPTTGKERGKRLMHRWWTKQGRTITVLDYTCHNDECCLWYDDRRGGCHYCNHDACICATLQEADKAYWGDAYYVHGKPIQEDTDA